MKDLFLRKGAERRLRGGHLWVYSNEIDSRRSPLGDFAPGDPVVVRAAGGQLLGSAYMDPHALICARLYAPGRECALDEQLFTRQLGLALSLREELFDAPYYRLAYGDSDGLPGVVADRYGQYVVLQLHNSGLERYREPLRAALLSLLQPSGILLRRDSRSRGGESAPEPLEVLYGEVPEEVELQENGVRFLAPLRAGQKTGWFYDHRLSRARLAQRAAGKRVLDVYSYIGAWGLQAAAAGAASVCCVDSSAAALEAVAASAQRNGVADRVGTRRGSAAQVLADMRDAGERFEIVVLDPPAFIQRKKDLKKGIAAYRRINELALHLLQPGGLLVSASCSMHLSRAELIGALAQASARAGCGVQIIEQGGQGPDHPIHPAIPETGYLKTLFARRLPMLPE
ncbi:MAG: RlmI/RlmK family 23S rRNA methyltransferase [Halioglobus sp.]|nr:RlmI/RlmK family 23S rRNA methyltransferase [Halioglobus sp.]